MRSFGGDTLYWWCDSPLKWRIRQGGGFFYQLICNKQIARQLLYTFIITAIVAMKIMRLHDKAGLLTLTSVIANQSTNLWPTKTPCWRSCTYLNCAVINNHTRVIQDDTQTKFGELTMKINICTWSWFTERLRLKVNEQNYLTPLLRCVGMWAFSLPKIYIQVGGNLKLRQIIFMKQLKGTQFEPSITMK